MSLVLNFVPKPYIVIIAVPNNLFDSVSKDNFTDHSASDGFLCYNHIIVQPHTTALHYFDIFLCDRLNILVSYCTNTTKYWLRAIFKENELASSPLILHKANILWN